MVSTDEKKSKLKDYLDKNLILYFYPKDLTPGCTSESIEFNENLTKIRRLGWDVVGISRDSIKSHKKFIEKYFQNKNEVLIGIIDYDFEKATARRKINNISINPEQRKKIDLDEGDRLITIANFNDLEMVKQIRYLHML